MIADALTKVMVSDELLLLMTTGRWRLWNEEGHPLRVAGSIANLLKEYAGVLGSQVSLFMLGHAGASLP